MSKVLSGYKRTKISLIVGSTLLLSGWLNAASFTVDGTSISSDGAGFSQQSSNTFYLPNTNGDLTTLTFSDGRGITITSTNELSAFDSSANANIVGILTGGSTINAIIGYGFFSDVIIADAVSGETLISGNYNSLWSGYTGFAPAFVIDYSNGSITIRAVNSNTRSTPGDETINPDGSFSFTSGPTYFSLGSFLLAGGVIVPLYTLEDATPSLLSSSYGLTSTITTTSLLLHGAHSRPMSRYVAPQQKTFWVAGDFGTDNHGDRDGKIGLAEFGTGYNYGPVQLNVALGQTWTDQNLIHSGEIDADGVYLMLESIIPVSLENGVYATLNAYHHWGDVDVKRGYLVNGTQNFSSGSADSKTWGVRARVDWVDALSVKTTSFSPYVDLSYYNAVLDAYTESSGDFPAQFDKRKDEITEFRLGVNSATPLNSSGLDFVANVEAAHRFDGSASNTTGQIAGAGLSFNVAGQSYKQNWLKAGVGLEGAVGDGKFSVMLNGTTKSEKSDAWLALSYTMAF